MTRATATTLLLALSALACSHTAPAPGPSPSAAAGDFVPGIAWLDTNGERIEAHGGGILTVGRTYYWYGENHKLGGGNKTGLSERPKVVYNRATKQYVMWMHLDANRYTDASAGVAVSASPTGPFRVVRIFRPIQYDYGYSSAEATEKERELGNTYRDVALFLDDDARAYAIYASESNKTLYAVRLNADYTDIERPAVEGKTWARLFPGARREAPAPFKVGNSYYLITSGQSGWAPNPARYHVAENRVPFVVRPDGSIQIEFRPRWNLGAFK